MNKSTLKGFIAGIIFASIGITTIFAASGIKSAEFNSNKVIFNGKELSLGITPMISVVKDGEQNMSNYMPVRAVLEQMGYNVDWDGTNNAVIVNDKKVENIQTQTPNVTALSNDVEQASLKKSDFQEVTWILNDTTLSGIIYNGEEYYGVQYLIGATGIPSELINNYTEVEFRIKEEQPNGAYIYKPVLTIPLSDKRFITVDYRPYISRKDFEENIMSLYQ